MVNMLILSGTRILLSAQVAAVAASETIYFFFIGLGGGIRLVIHVWLMCLDTMECGRLQGCHIKAVN